MTCCWIEFGWIKWDAVSTLQEKQAGGEMHYHRCVHACLPRYYFNAADRVHCCGSAISSCSCSKPPILLRKFRFTYRARRESTFLAALPHRLFGIEAQALQDRFYQAAARCLEQRVLLCHACNIQSELCQPDANSRRDSSAKLAGTARE